MGLGCGLGCMPALSVMHSTTLAAVCGYWRYVSAVHLPLRHVMLTVTAQGSARKWH